MVILVSLAAVAEEMELLSEDSYHAFLNRQTGELYSGTTDQLSKAEEYEDEELLTWEVEVIQRLREILGSADWLELPHRNSHSDYLLMERFCNERCEGQIQEELLSAITGRGAFGRFKAVLHRHGVQEAWYGFRRELLTEEAKAWLQSQKIPFRH